MKDWSLEDTKEMSPDHVEASGTEPYVEVPTPTPVDDGLVPGVPLPTESNLPENGNPSVEVSTQSPVEDHLGSTIPSPTESMLPAGDESIPTLAPASYRLT